MSGDKTNRTYVQRHRIRTDLLRVPFPADLAGTCWVSAAHPTTSFGTEVSSKWTVQNDKLDLKAEVPLILGLKHHPRASGKVQIVRKLVEQHPMLFPMILSSIARIQTGFGSQFDSIRPFFS